MPADIPSLPPSSIRAGDTANWRRSLSDYLASEGWALKYTLVATDGLKSFDATADGDDFTISVAASATATWTAGRCTLVEYVTKGSERYTLGSYNLQVLPDLTAATSGADTRTFAQKALDAIEAWMTAKTPTAGAFEFNGRKIQNYPLPDLMAWRDKLRAEVARENAAAGGGVVGQVKVRL
jgi:hypothetical protein